nr:Chain C, Bu31-10 peptide [Rattus norvegicus]6NF7_F Chain F, Bu31-10 peptide [Rattus norvegicus]6NF7_I Chain I, Bu31-10 peptide [Rattus norvegicus]6NF7_L Chain L, Bu31-10 peptide [Rattus norvegicus]6NF7_O Chain O, Bu31-10 peptide [Rattus norvegicus]
YLRYDSDVGEYR